MTWPRAWSTPDRILCLTHEAVEPRQGDYVLYWMQRAQRSGHNDALEHAARLANEHTVPLLVCFGVTDDHPEATARHYRFMLEGLADTVGTLRRRDIGVTIRRGSPPVIAAELAADAVLVVTDRAYERHLIGWCQQLVRTVDRPILQVECDVVVPVQITSDRREHAARTIRRKIHARLDYDVDDLLTTSLDEPMSDAPDSTWTSPTSTLLSRDSGSSSPTTRTWSCVAALPRRARTCACFLDAGLRGYAERRRNPREPMVSYLSAYLHFGQVSLVSVLLDVRAAVASSADVSDCIEELVVHREMAANFMHFERDYDSFRTLPDGPAKRSTSTATTSAPRLHRHAAGGGARTIRPGTRPWLRCAPLATCTITCACTGASRSCAGRAAPSMRSGQRWS